MGDLKGVAIVCTEGDGGWILCARPSEIDACQYHGFNYMAVVRFWGGSVTFRLWVTRWHADAARWDH